MCQALYDVRGKPALFGAYNLMSGQTAHKCRDQSAKKLWRRETWLVLTFHLAEVCSLSLNG